MFALDCEWLDTHSHSRDPSRQMRTIKAIAGLCCIVAAFFVGRFAKFSFMFGPLWFKNLITAFILGLFVLGLFLIFKWCSPVSARARLIIAAGAALLVLTPVVLVAHIRHERKALQTRSIQFLALPVPEAFDTNELGGYRESQEGNVLVCSRKLIERYARNGRIRWSAVIQGQFATAPFGISGCEDVVGTDTAARLYLEECKAILDEEWRMGYWQWVEDTIEFRRVIPEIAEEDSSPSLSNRH